MLGFLSAAWGFAELATGRIAEDRRPGFARERTILWYTSSYLAGVMWLSLRLSPLYPAALTPLDPALCAATIAVYVFGFVSPLRTVLVHWEELTPTEQLRMKGMVASGAVGPNPKPNPNPNPKPKPNPNPSEGGRRLRAQHGGPLAEGSRLVGARALTLSLTLALTLALILALALALTLP